MGLSLRYYLFDTKGNIKRLSISELDRLEKGESALPEYASSTVNVAEAVLHLENRKPELLIRVVGFKMHFDSRGSCKKSGDEQSDLTRKSISYHMSSLMSSGKPTGDRDLIPAEREFTEKALNDRFRWDPTLEDINRLIDVIWPPPKPPAETKKRHLKLVKG